jgi:hypothetical protein
MNVSMDSKLIQLSHGVGQNFDYDAADGSPGTPA